MNVLSIISSISSFASNVLTPVRYFRNLLRFRIPFSLPRPTFSLTILWVLWIIGLFSIWWWGPRWHIGDISPLSTPSRQVVATLGMLLLALVVIIVYLYSQISTTAAIQQQDESEPYKNSMEQQSGYLQTWLAQYQQRSHRRNAMYARPWYIVMGESLSGKTSLIQKSNQIIPIGTADTPTIANKEGSGAKTLQLWLTQQAVIIDPPGEFFGQNSSDEKSNEITRGHALRLNLQDWLMKVRQRQPLNGAILTINIQEIMEMTAEARREWSQKWQAYILEMSDRFACRIPVYLVFTKLDVMTGFETVYPVLERSRLDETLGITFALDTVDDDSWRKELTQFWGEWQENFNNLMPDQMVHRTSLDLRSALFNFVGQIAGVKLVVEELITGLKRHYNRDPGRQMLIRGCYFTSSLQQNRRSDFFSDAVCRHYKLHVSHKNVWANQDNQRSYFIPQLFNQVLFSEPNLAGENHEHVKIRRHNLTLIAVISGGFALLLLSGWYYYYLKNYHAGEVALNKVSEFQKLGEPVSKLPLGADWLPHMDLIRDATMSYGDYREKNQFMSDMGLYQGAKIGQLVEKTYLRLLESRFLPVLMKDLQQHLDSAPANSEEKLALLRIMRMIDDKSGRNIPLVEDYMRARWQTAYTGQRDVQERLMTHLDYALQHTDWALDRSQSNAEAIKMYEPFASSIRSAQIELSKLPLYQRVYQNLIIKAKTQLPQDMDLRTEIGAQFDTVFVADNEDLLKVPQFWSRYGLSRFFVKQTDKLVSITALDSWVLGLTDNVDYSDADKAEIERQITERYVGDYTSTWRNAVNNLSIRPFDDVEQASDALDAVLNNGQPLWRTLVLLGDNTQPHLVAALSSEVKTPSVVVAKGQKDNSVASKVLNSAQKESLNQLDNQPEYLLLNRISRSFSEQNALVENGDDQNGQVQQAYKALNEMSNELHRISNAPEPGKAALLLVQMRLQQNNADAFFTAQQLSKNLSDPLGRWVEQLAENSWNTVTALALKSLEAEWSKTVVTPFTTQMADRYPFDPKATKEVALSDMERFFAPNGTLDSFYKNNLKVFIEDSGSLDRDGNSLIRPEILTALEQGEKIRSTFFSAQNGFGIQFAVAPVDLSSNKRRAVLNLDGQLLDYTQGNSHTAHLVWPNTMRAGNESKLTLVPDISGGSPRSMGYVGPWAMFRLWDKGELTNVQDSSFDVRFSVDSGTMTYRVFMDASNNPFAGGLFSQFTLTDQLY